RCIHSFTLAAALIVGERCCAAPRRRSGCSGLLFVSVLACLAAEGAPLGVLNGDVALAALVEAFAAAAGALVGSQARVFEVGVVNPGVDLSGCGGLGGAQGVLLALFAREEGVEGVGAMCVGVGGAVVDG